VELESRKAPARKKKKRREGVVLVRNLETRALGDLRWENDVWARPAKAKCGQTPGETKIGKGKEMK